MKTNILFMTKEFSLMGNIKTYFIEERERYNLYFAQSPGKAFKIVEEKNINILFLDDDFENKSELELIENLTNSFPEVIRIALTKTNIPHGTKLLQFAHQVVEKPINIETIFNKIKKIRSLRKYITDPNIIKVINKISQLPTLPTTYLELEKELAKPERSMHRIGKIIAHDFSLSLKILQVVNSPFFGLRKKITLPAQAVNYLGINVLRSLILYHKMYESFKVPNDLKSFFENVWIHSNKVGRFAEEIIFKYYRNEIEMMEDAYIAGLLHDVGKVIMLGLPNYPYNVFELKKKKNIRFSDAEYEIYGISHSEVAAYFLALWDFPERVVDAVYSHKRNSNLSFARLNMATSVCIANMLVTDLDMDIQTLKELRLDMKPFAWVKYIEDRKKK